ncbi:SUMF1/EgtB/PvdO family nonheme iron enzyme [Archangium violaceum]|uniref:bifunctional serine/threonine-protein kinase/formylglycine-generating enzyme family protein n=1 Tax=Archangium violaceum TaxID=83451 RepID=UPI00193BAB57|nr:bifunctional serine/threonine-protein kinase/formylglycine-generating enzyme family protein [Archangium violaceum]QRK06879.1 SUMF1/EgtB/PvdO family nonheme iron enzyme [Archangium violaceum]
MTAWRPPGMFEEYRLLRPLGRGSMGEVYLAQDTVLDRPVAVKFIASEMPDEAQRERFRTEARAIARVQHPNVVAVHRVGEVQRHPYLVSEFVRGESLERLPRPLSWQRVLAIGIGLARGLAAAHRRGVLHRDIKPANVMLSEEGELKLLDFGVAKLLDVAGGLAEPRLSAPLSTSSWGPSGDSGTGQDTVDLEETSRPPALAATAPSGPPPENLPAPVTGLVGTPLYLAPEIWRGESATPRSDLYSLGVLLYELCSGTLPHMESTLRALSGAVQHQPAAPLVQVAPQVEPAFAAIIDRCLSREPADRFASAEALREALEALQENTRGHEDASERPYPGLHTFSARDRATFFGRASEARVVLERLRAEPLVVVAGDSGAGKSSLCRAGVVPRVAEGALGPGGMWAVCELLPGRRPLASLAAVLAPLLGSQESELLEVLRQEPAALGRRVRMQEGPRGVLVFVDQLEEVLTLAAAEDAECFAQALGGLAGCGPRLRVLATVRGDFLARMAALPGLGEALSGGLYLLRHLDEAGLREAIVAPARARGFRFESERMVEELVAAGRTEGGLPLLQFALAELWERRDPGRRVVPAEALVAWGGVEGALARHADGVLAGLRPGQREAARKLLLRLVLSEGTRARRPRSELLGEAGWEQEEARVALEALVHGRLVVAREAAGEQGTATYELAHEALVRGWDTLRGWLAGSEEQRVLRQRLERACAEWQRLGGTNELLWSGRQLEEAERLDEESLSPAEASFLRDSRRAVWRRRLVRIGAALLLPLTAAGVYGGLELKSWREREQGVTRSLAAARLSVAKARERGGAAEESRRQSLEIFDTYDWADAEPSWARTLALAEEGELHYAEATRQLEAALLRDSHRPELRYHLSEVLYERILLAERHRHSPELLEELKRRLPQVDDTREFRRRLEAPAHLNVESEPGGAQVLLERAEDEQGRLRWSTPRPLGTTPLEDVELPAGSYRLTLQRPDRPPVLYPVLLGRDERHTARVPMPASVPEGFVYVPPGRFLLGSGDPEIIRLNLVPTRPLHEAATEGFLIARHEVTYAEWLTFLRTLPPAERARHRPHGTNYFGTIEVRERRDGSWEFLLEHEGNTYRVREGKRLRYLDRTLRAEQDWLRFPVSGISWEDVRAYLGWLDRTGRLRGARPCNEREWERAARGADGRDYPHGNRLEPDDANFDATYGRRSRAFGPDEVGSHPASDSPFGVADLAGNVWEWMVTPTSPPLAAYGGGCFYQDKLTARGLNHGDADPQMRWPFVGLRVCAPAPAP